MIPIFLDPVRARLALIGRGALAVRRLAWLKAAGANPDVWSDAPSEALMTAAGDNLKRGLPSLSDLAGYNALWLADVSRNEAQMLAATAASVNVLVNVEDVIALSSFHSPAVVRRGRLTLAAGTGGASPTVARAARERLEAVFPDEWGEALEDIAQSRATLREEGANSDTLIADARERLAAHGLA